MKNQFGRPIDNKFSSLDPLSLARYSHPDIGCLHYSSSTLSLISPHSQIIWRPYPTKHSTQISFSHFDLDPKIQTKPTSLSKHAFRVVTRAVQGSLYRFLFKIAFLLIFYNYFIVTFYFSGKVMIFMATCFFLL